MDAEYQFKLLDGYRGMKNRPRMLQAAMAVVSGFTARTTEELAGFSEQQCLCFALDAITYVEMSGFYIFLFWF